ncbi:ICOS ligand-like [Paralichthys olivaceus]|uniref:ICOS ligand-like n=1 Tax=Paralichthys olivaceus TaxID=8255 RepID=UPI00097DE3F1|nr:PREDICTED: ICOS ligand-like [Paralichthys olivaceus]
MPVTLCRPGLLLSFITVCSCLDPDCVLGIVGRPVSLPCIYPNISTSVNVSIEWRRGEEVVLRSDWGEDGQWDRWSRDSAVVPADAALTGNMSLLLPTVDPKEDNTYYSLFIVSEGNQSAAVCTVCLRIAASFSPPLVHRGEAEQGEETAFSCHSTGGFPEPAVYWLINDTKKPPEGSVRTLTTSLPDSHLYNITSHLTVNISKDSRVSCMIENLSMNQNLTSTSYGVKSRPLNRRASEAMWIFSTALCVVVGIMVIVGVGYQIHLDRINKRKKKAFRKHQLSRVYDREHQNEEETEDMKPVSKETDV